MKVLDFGLAKAADDESIVSDPSNSPTLSIRATQGGVILGTAAYMSPEQASAKSADRRADIWSFGVVLWEMLCGGTLFEGESISHTLAAVLAKDLAWDKLPPETPPSIHKLLRRCLERDRRKRLQAIGEARIAIEEHLANPAGASVITNVAPVLAPMQRGRVLPWVAAAVFALSFFAVAALHFREIPPEQRLMRLLLGAPEKTRFGDFAISPDGRRLAFGAAESGKFRLWVRRLDSDAAQPLPGNDGGSYPFWSPESRVIGFFAENKLKKMDASGGPVQTICTALRGRGGAWNRDGVILFGNFGDPIFRVSADGGEATHATAVDASSQENTHHWPVFLPDGRHFLYRARRLSQTGGIYVGALDSKDRTRLLESESNAVYAGDTSSMGYLLFWRAGSLMAQPFDASKLRLTGSAFPLAGQLGYNAGLSYSPFSVSNTGVLVYDSTRAEQNRQLVWFDRAGKPVATVGEPGSYSRVSLSPDEKQLAADRGDNLSGTGNIWITELERGTSTRFTFEAKRDRSPVWSPDGAQIVFESTRDSSSNLYRKIASGAGKEELLLKSGSNAFPTELVFRRPVPALSKNQCENEVRPDGATALG